MRLERLILTENECCKTAKPMTPRGIMLHSTGADNPNLRRYVGPDDGLLGYNRFGNHWNTLRPGGRQVCVHAFIGRLADGGIASYQTLPWQQRGWHAGRGKKGSANATHIGIEICEDSLSDGLYFDSVYREAAELCAYLCIIFGLPAESVICHSEGYALGIASNHADVSHWFPRHGKSMGTFRADVARLISVGHIPPVFGAVVNVPSPIPQVWRVQLGAFSKRDNAAALLERVKNAGFSDAFLIRGS
ncbi:MAG: amidase [Clostridiales bacterium]|nr:amidase [Clostridiales bacterium]